MENVSTELTVVLDAFREHLLAEDTSQHTMTAYLSDVRQFVAWYTQTYQDFVLADVTPTDIRRYREELQGLSPMVSAATIDRRLASLLTFLRILGSYASSMTQHESDALAFVHELVKDTDALPLVRRHRGCVRANTFQVRRSMQS